MAGDFNVLVLALFAAAILLGSSEAQTRYIVGDALGWTIPPGGAAAYTTWALNKTFTVGDILVFNFTNGAHDVAQVTKSAYDSCNSDNTIFDEDSSPASITLNETGEHYYLCTVSNHCSLGQKLVINVTSVSSPVPTPTLAPQPTPRATPSPQSTPAPSPSREPATYTVGDSLGWTIPSGGAAAYQTWASNKTFFVGDTLLFNFAANTHDVAEVTKDDYDSCDTNSTLSLETNPPVRITLERTGEHFYTCTYPRHCSLGQKLAINVSESGTATPPSGTNSPSSPSPTSGLSPPPPDSSAKSLGFPGLSATLITIAVALFY